MFFHPPLLSLPANVPTLPLLPLIHLFRAADCLLPESVLPTGPDGDGGSEVGKGRERKGEQRRNQSDSGPCGTCTVNLFQVGETQICAF